MDSNWAGLINELNHASTLLDSAINRYSEACASILSHYKSGSDAGKDLIVSSLKELTKIVPYESKFEQAKALLRRIRNQNTDLVPINILPSEVMTHVFRFLCLSGGCYVPTRANLHPENCVVYPDNLLGVCSRWRQIVLESHDLWTHIDMELSKASSFKEMLSLRAGAFVGKSGQVPLHFHLRAKCPPAQDDHSLFEFFQSLAPRIQAFSIECVDGWLDLDEEQSLFGAVFPRLLPGTLTHLSIHAYYTAFFVPLNSIPSDRPFVTIPLTEQQLEGILAPVTTLHLKDIYPLWTSCAYNGLVELILDGAEFSSVDITESELARILWASPALQIFRLGLSMRLGPVGAPTIQLNDLYLLELNRQGHSSLEALFRMIHPGRTPLEVCIEATRDLDFLSPSWAGFADFAARSNIHKLGVKFKFEGYRVARLHFYPSELFSVFPRLAELVLQGSVIGQKGEDLLGDYDALAVLSMFQLESFPPNRLRVLVLRGCFIYSNDFRHISEIHPTEKLVIHDCEVSTPIRASRRSRMLDWQDDLNHLCPKVEITKSSPTYEYPFVSSYRSPSPDIYAPGDI